MDLSRKNLNNINEEWNGLRHSGSYNPRIIHCMKFISLHQLNWFRFINFICEIDGMNYYNSISRQSGIVHKDKAMRQLDLDLWQWLMVAYSGWRQQRHWILIQLAHGCLAASIKIKWVMRQRRIPAANYIHLFNEIK